MRYCAIHNVDYLASCEACKTVPIRACPVCETETCSNCVEAWVFEPATSTAASNAVKIQQIDTTIRARAMSGKVFSVVVIDWQG